MGRFPGFDALQRRGRSVVEFLVCRECCVEVEELRRGEERRSLCGVLSAANIPAGAALPEGLQLGRVDVERRQAVDLERVLAERLDADPHLLERRRVSLDPFRVARRELESLGQQ